MAKTLLQVECGSFGYPGDRVLFHDVSFSVGEGEVFTILGANGAGKTSLLKCLVGLLNLSSGTVKMMGDDVNCLSPRQLALRVGYVPQIHIAAYAYSVRDFVVMGRAPHIPFLKSPSIQDYSLADEALRRLGMAAFAGRPYTQLSGGERQQVLIARVLAQQPRLIIMDEPTNHLDYGNQIRALKVIRGLGREGYGVIFTTHTPDYALLVDGLVGVLDATGVLMAGPAREVISEERLSSLYDMKLCMDYVPRVGRVACISPGLDDCGGA